uniref:DUF1275 domain protein n=1 Tax=Amphora coffeiformis TaxID=265554 RepID=A0A7S3P8J7_9STRA|mmetsp:Transcript_7972/g.15206  ORF Transcript_7972/g.15206 Transcript_7972/m.15206 type:complete len:291 (+) Transcript_7972:144-1016(+)
MMYFRRFLLVAAALVSSCVDVQAKSSSKTVIADTRRQQGRFGLPKSSASSVVQAKSPSLVSTRGGGDSQKAAVVLGLILALNSGFINGCCLSGAITANGAKQAVAAVTASWTNGALGMASGDMKQFSFLTQVIGAFMGGSAIAGFLNPRPTLFQVSTSTYAIPLSIGGIMLAVASQLVTKTDTVKLGFLLCAMANGIQNSMTSTLTGNLCRTSHYSGITSDMGTFIGQILGGNNANMYKLKVFMGLGACFWAGGFISYSIGKEYGATSLLFAAGLYAVIIALYESFAKKL